MKNLCTIRLVNGECSSVGRAPDCGSGCRGFEPHRSPHCNYMLIVISGPSGVGKGTLIHHIRNTFPQLVVSTSATTRSPRPGEIEGVDYYFLSKKAFQEKIDDNAFLEWCLVHTNYYGTLRSDIEAKCQQAPAVIIEIDVQGAKKIRAHTHIPQYHVFIAPPSLTELENRLRARKTDTDIAIQKRLTEAKQELREKNNYNKIIINNTLTQSYSEIDNTIKDILYHKEHLNE